MSKFKRVSLGNKIIVAHSMKTILKNNFREYLLDYGNTPLRPLKTMILT